MWLESNRESQAHDCIEEESYSYDDQVESDLKKNKEILRYKEIEEQNICEQREQIV